MPWSLVRLRESRAIAILLVPLFYASGCNDKEIGDIYSPEEWRDLLESAGGWTPLPIPDSKYREGSIVQVNDSGIRWIGDLTSCRFPVSDFTKSGSIPNVNFSKGMVFSAEALVNYAGISAGPRFESVGGAVLVVGEHSTESIDLIALRVWQEVPANRQSVSAVCFEELDRPDRYLITEAFVASDATYTLVQNNGAKLEVTAPLASSLLDAQAGIGLDATSDGRLSVDQPTVFGIRKAVRVDQRFEILGESADIPETADDYIEEIFLRQYSP